VTTKFINQLTVQRNGKSAVATYFLMVMLSTVDANLTANGTREDYEESRSSPCDRAGVRVFMEPAGPDVKSVRYPKSKVATFVPVSCVSVVDIVNRQ
jgi:hypothetical protein